MTTTCLKTQTLMTGLADGISHLDSFVIRASDGRSAERYARQLSSHARQLSFRLAKPKRSFLTAVRTYEFNFRESPAGAGRMRMGFHHVSLLISSRAVCNRRSFRSLHSLVRMAQQ